MMRAKSPSRLMRITLAAALLLAAAGAGAQAIGRLFNTAAERGQLDSARNARPGGAGQPAPAPDAAQPGPYPGAGQAAPYAGANQAVPYPGGNQADNQPAPYPGANAGANPGGNPGEPPPPPQPPQTLVMNGVLRTSSGRSTVWLNDIPQSGRQMKVVQRAHSAPQLTVQLPSGKKVLLKPGQRYDLADGRVKDINEP